MRSTVLGFFFFLTFQGLATTYYVAKSNPCASDENSGLLIDCDGIDGPLYSIEYATSLLLDNDSIVIGAGTYFEHPLIGGLQGITISPYGDGMVTISGAMEEYTIEDNGLWTDVGERYSAYHDTNFHVFSADYPPGVVVNPVWTNTLVQNMAVDENGRKMYTYGDSILFNLRHQPDADGICFDYDKMYISFENPARNPNELGLYISRFWEVLYFYGGAEVIVDGGPEKLLTIDHSGRFGIRSSDGARMTLRNMIIKNGHNTVYESPTAGSTLIENCSFQGGHSPQWTWTGIKDCLSNPGGDVSLSGCYTMPDLSANPNPIDGLVSQESFAILLRSDTAFHTIRNCEIEGFFNGIAPLAGSGLIEGNRIWNIFDDAIEPEGEVDLIIRDNLVWDSFVCHAGVTTENGPVYAYENVYCASKDIMYSYDFVSDEVGEVWKPFPIKYYGTSSSNPSTNTHFYYNTIYGTRKPLQLGSGGCVEQYSASNTSVFNNIFLSEAHISSNSGLATEGVEIRSNLFYTYGNPSPRYNCWNGTGGWNELPPMPETWTGNMDADPLFEQGDFESPLEYFAISQASPAREPNGFLLEPVPLNWPGAEILNMNRSNAGAIEFDGSVSTKEFDQEELRIIPNPTSAQLRVMMPIGGGYNLISITDMEGRLVYQLQVTPSEFIELDVSGLNSGVYLLTAQSPNEFMGRRLLLE